MALNSGIGGGGKSGNGGAGGAIAVLTSRTSPKSCEIVHSMKLPFNNKSYHH